MLAIVGYGKMGRLIDQLAPEYGFTVTARIDVDRDESLEGADVAVEFSVPSAVLGNIRKVAALRIPIVIGTTGWLEHLAEAKAIIEAERLARWSGARISRSALTSSRAWWPKPRVCSRTKKNTAPGPGRSITSPRKTRLPARC